MSTITKITAYYSRRVAPDGDFTHREGNATIEVSAEDLENGNIETELDEAMNQAHDIVHRYIGIGGGKSKAGSSNGSSSNSTQPPGNSSKGNISDNPEDRKDPDADEETPAEKKKRLAAEKRKATAAKKKAAEAEAAATAAAESGGEDDDFDFDGDGDDDANAPDEITDDDLQKAANAVVVRLQGEGLEGTDAPKAVSKVIKGFKPEDHEGKFGISMVGQKSRRKFIEMIDALQGPDAD